MIIKTIQGEVRGLWENGLIVFKGIPYGEAPIEKLRFKAPVPKLPWNGVLECYEFGKKSMQYAGGDKNMLNEQGEDCLYLNIWMRDNNIKNKSVVVYIHGGGFMGGSGSDELYAGDKFGADNNIIYITINYRLGALGFLKLKDILGNDYSTSGNNGILDIILGLKWVNENIEAFGGDKNKITVMGESAGAKCIGGLLVAEEAKGLFNKAILQSGATQSLRNEKTSTEIAKRLLDKLNLDKDNPERLLELSPVEIVKAQNSICEFSSIHIFGPTIDGQVIPYDYKVLGKDDGLDAVLMGVNKEEILIFLNGEKNPLRDRNLKALDETFGNNLDTMWKVYDGYSKTMETTKAYEETLTHCYYRYHSLKLGESLADSNVEVWFYKFNYSGKFGPCHAQDLAFVFNKSMPNDDLHTIPQEAQSIADTIHETWKTFIKSDNPNNIKMPKWENYTKENRAFMNLGYDFYMDNKWSEEELQYFPNEVLSL